MDACTQFHSAPDRYLPGERATVLGVAFGGLAVAGLLGWLRSPAAAAELGGLVAVCCAGVGKLLPLWGLSDRSSFGPFELGLAAWTTEFATLLVVVYAAPELRRFDRIRRALDAAQGRAKRSLSARPRLRRMAVVGIALMVFLPLPGTGAVVAGTTGILLGMRRRWLLVTVGLGSLTGCMAIAVAVVYCSDVVVYLSAMQASGALRYPAIVAGAFIVLLIARRFGAARRLADHKNGARHPLIESSCRE